MGCQWRFPYVERRTTRGCGNSAGWAFNGTYSYFGLVGVDAPASWTQYSVTFGPNSTCAIPSNARFVSVGALLNFGSVANCQAAITQIKLLERTDASLIVDGTITASKIAAGAITADMITTGTLNAANVAVTNFNASNITTGTLSATKVLFADGSALTTASRVISASVSSTSNSSTSGTTVLAIPGLAFSVNAASTSDVYNVFVTLSAENSQPANPALSALALTLPRRSQMLLRRLTYRALRHHRPTYAR